MFKGFLFFSSQLQKSVVLVKGSVSIKESPVGGVTSPLFMCYQFLQQQEVSEGRSLRWTDRMQKAVTLVSVLVLGSVWTLQGLHTRPEPLPLPQEDFNLDRFMGRWFEVAVISTCPHYMQRKRGNPVIVALQLQHVASQGNFTMIATFVRNGSCQQTSTVYDLTNTPGRFFHHVFRFDAEVDSYVVKTNYNEYAMMLLLSTEKPSGNKTTTIKLYSRTVDVSPAVLLNFTALVRQHGMSDEAIIMNQKKGECVSLQLVTEPTAQPQISAPKKSKRNVVPRVDSHNI